MEGIKRDETGDRILKFGNFRNHSSLSNERVSLEFRLIKTALTMRELTGRLKSNKFEKVYEEEPELPNLEKRNGSFPVLSGEQIWVTKRFIGSQHIAYIREQHCNDPSYTSTVYVRIKGPVDDMLNIAWQLNR